MPNLRKSGRAERRKAAEERQKVYNTLTPQQKLDRLPINGESKKEIKKSTGMSPDITDAMILTFARPVMRKDVRADHNRRRDNGNGPPRAIMSDSPFRT